MICALSFASTYDNQSIDNRIYTLSIDTLNGHNNGLVKRTIGKQNGENSSYVDRISISVDLMSSNYFFLLFYVWSNWIRSIVCRKVSFKKTINKNRGAESSKGGAKTKTVTLLVCRSLPVARCQRKSQMNSRAVQSNNHMYSISAVTGWNVSVVDQRISNIVALLHLSVYRTTCRHTILLCDWPPSYLTLDTCHYVTALRSWTFAISTRQAALISEGHTLPFNAWWRGERPWVVLQLKLW